MRQCLRRFDGGVLAIYVQQPANDIVTKPVRDDPQAIHTEAIAVAAIDGEIREAGTAHHLWERGTDEVWMPTHWMPLPDPPTTPPPETTP